MRRCSDEIRACGLGGRLSMACEHEREVIGLWRRRQLLQLRVKGRVGDPQRGRLAFAAEAAC